MLISQLKDHVVDTVLLHEVDSDLHGEAREGWYTADMILQCAVHHWYHLHARIVTGGNKYYFKGY